MRSLRRIWADQGGNTAILFGLAVIPVIALSGGVVDLSHRADIRMKVQSAADTAALAAARAIEANPVATADAAGIARRQAIAEEAAHNIFDAALSGTGTIAEPVVQIVDGVISVSSDVDVDTSFLPLIGIDSLAADGFAEVNMPTQTPVEIALVLDYSQSMEANNKYARMTSAARGFIAKIAASRGATTKIGIVPFSEYVLASMHGSDLRGVPLAQANATKSACLMNRDYPHASSSETPSIADPASRWPQADPDDCSRYISNAMQVRDLTNDFASLRDALAGMTPVGLTNIALASELGWHMLTPNAPFETASENADGRVEKILVVLTDGVQTVEARGPDGSTSVQAANETTVQLCRNAKQAGIGIYTIAYDVDDTGVYDLLRGCASTAQAYHEVHDSSGIDEVFEDIYRQITASVWLSR